MAINWDNLFEEIGKELKLLNQLRQAALGGGSSQPDLPARTSDIVGVYEGNSNGGLIGTLVATSDSFRSTMTGAATALAARIEARIRDRSVVDELFFGTNNVSSAALMLELYRQMVADSESVDDSTVAATVTADLLEGNGTLIVDTTLDGYQAPIAGGIANPLWAGELSELAWTEVQEVRCLTDSYSGGSEGSESFRWVGYPKQNDKFSWKQHGSGAGPSLSPVNGANKLSNGDFESFTSNAPTSWTLGAGMTAGTHVEEATDTADVYRGSSALAILGTGALATHQLTQSLSGLSLQPLRRYVITAAVRSDIGALDDGTLTIELTGTGYSAGSSEKITIAPGDYDSSWEIKSAFLNLPRQIPSDLAFSIKVTGTMTNAKSIWIDDVTLSPVRYHGGICAAIVAGPSPFVKGDRFTIDVTNNGGGVFQEFFRRWFGVQLPSSGSPTQANALAT